MNVSEKHIIKIISEVFNNEIAFLDIRNFDLSHSKLNELLLALLNNYSLRSIDFGGNVFNSKNAILLGEIIAQNKTIEDVKLNNCDLSGNLDQIASGISKNASIINLELQNTHIGTHGYSLHPFALAMRSNTTLRRLDLSNNYIVPANDLYLEDLENGYLYELILPGSNIGTKFHTPKARL